jgi:N-acetylmuramic acid 6-phosphate etherase
VSAPRRRTWGGLPTERVNPRSARLDRLGVAGVVALMQAEDARVLRALSSARPAIVRAAEAFRQTYAAGGTCFLVGAGTSGRLAVLEAAELPPTFGTDPRRVRAIVAGGRDAVFRSREGAEDRFAEGAGVAAAAGPRDLVIGVSASSVTPFVRGALRRARARGARTVLVTASAGAGLRRLASIVVALPVGPEVVAGSTRLKAGTAAKLALNQITTSALASSGRVFGPWMVDLSRGSAKLAERAVRVVAGAAGVKPAAARRLLARSGGEVKAAILMARTGASLADARSILSSSGGDLRSALEPPGAGLSAAARSRGGRRPRPARR